MAEEKSSAPLLGLPLEVECLGCAKKFAWELLEIGDGRCPSCCGSGDEDIREACLCCDAVGGLADEVCRGQRTP